MITELVPLSIVDIVFPLFFSGMLATSTILFVLAFRGQLKLLPRAVFGINLLAFIFAATEAAIFLTGGYLGNTPLSMRIMFVQSLFIFPFIPVNPYFCRSLMGVPKSPSPAFFRFKKILDIYQIVGWIFCVVCIIAALVHPDLLISVTKEAANPAHLAMRAGRGQEGPLYTLINIVALIGLFLLPVGVLFALRISGKTPEAPLFAISAIIPVWLSIESIINSLTGVQLGLLGNFVYPRAITGFGIFALLAAIGAYWRKVREAGELEADLAAFASELENRVAERSKELENAKDSLVEAEKFAVVGRLGASIAHELNTPLGAIISSIGLCNRELGPIILEYSEHAQHWDSSDWNKLNEVIDTGVRKGFSPGGATERALRNELNTKLEELGATEPRQRAAILAEIFPVETVYSALSWAVAPQSLEILTLAQKIINLKRSAELTAEAAQKAARVVKALSNYSRKEEERSQIVDAVSSIENLFVLYYGSIKQKITLKLDWACKTPVIGMRDRLDQVWVNLINNALQAMEYSGTLSFASRREASMVVFSLTDSGPGIPQELQSRIFEPFFTTKRHGEGLGLGLEVSKRIVEAFGGSISFESVPGKTTFYVRLQAAEE